jgi:hypothetical protein
VTSQEELAINQARMATSQQWLKASLPVAFETDITPSRYNKSEATIIFFDLLAILGLPRQPISDLVVEYEESSSESNPYANFTFRWVVGSKESDAYPPLQNYLESIGILTRNVSSGKHLPQGCLYYKQLWTLRDNISSSSAENGKVLMLKYNLSGRTDFVRIKNKDLELGESNIRYFIEVKPVGFTLEEALRECVLQLIGGNASNSFHSPPVLLTNLNGLHFVLFITQVGDPREALAYKLNVLKMRSLSTALGWVEKRTSTMRSETLHLGRKPTPSSSPIKFGKTDDNEDETGDNEVEYISDRFDNVILEAADLDENGDSDC